MKSDTKVKSNIPHWAKRRMALVNKKLLEDDTQEYLRIMHDLINHYFKTLKQGWNPEEDDEIQYLSAQIAILSKFPRGSQKLLIRLATKKILKVKEAVKCLNPPFRIISFTDEYIGPTEWVNNNEYSSYAHLIHEQTSKKTSIENKLFEEDEVYINVRVDTSKEELIAFIEAYYESEIRPHLKPAVINFHDEVLVNPKRRIKGYKNADKFDLNIMSMHNQGLSAYQIANKLGLERYSPQVIDRKLKKIKKIQFLEFKIVSK
jgi:hypothetical protein